jgi:hypothetical protein
MTYLENLESKLTLARVATHAQLDELTEPRFHRRSLYRSIAERRGAVVRYLEAQIRNHHAAAARQAERDAQHGLYQH